MTTTILQMHTGKTTPRSDAEADRRFTEMKQLATRLVRRIKDDALEDAVLVLVSHLLDVQLRAEQALLTQITAGLNAPGETQQ